MEDTEILELFMMMTGEDFAEVDESIILMWLELCQPLVSQKKFGKLYYQVLVLLAAHRMSMNGLGKGSSFGTVADSLRVSNYKEGDVSVTYASTDAAQSGDSDLDLTVYGKQYLSLKKSVIIPIISAGVGQ